MKRQAQVTIFIIIGIIILVASGILFFIQTDQISEDETVFFQDTSSLEIFIEGCLSAVAEDGIFYIGERGGYYDNKSVDFFTTFNFKDQYDLIIPFYYYLNDYYVPTIPEIEKQLSLYVEDNLESCLSNFESFTAQGWKITGSDFSVNTTFTDENILLDLNYPLIINISGEIIEKESFQNSVGLDFLSVYDVVEQTISYQQQSPNFIIVGDIGQLSQIYNFSHEIDYMGDGVVWYSLLFNQDLRPGYPYEWGFAAKYNWEDVFEG